MIIALSGMPGSGKSSVADILSRKLGYKHYSAGDFRREMARKKGISISELNKIGEKDVFTDKQVDDFQMQLGKHEDNFVIDGRLSWHFIKSSIKVFLDAKPAIRAMRIFQDERKEEKFKTLDDAKKSLAERVKSDKKRYKKYYGVDAYDKSTCHFTIDTSRMTAEEVADEIIKLTKDIKEEISAGAIVVNNKKEYLLLYQSKGKFWEFPKGHLEKQETELGAMKREILEETNIKTFELFKGFKEVNEYTFKEKKGSGKSKLISKKVVLFLIGTSDEIKLSHEHTKYKWAALKDALKLLKFDDMKLILEKADMHIRDYIKDKNSVWLK